MISTMQLSPVEGDMPWDLGVFDAHCHPTENMASIQEISHMKTTSLAIMATRPEDQELVAQVAQERGIQVDSSADSSPTNFAKRVVPSFGWHPWFSHQIYDDVSEQKDETLDGPAKTLHYQSVLKPRLEDMELLATLPDPCPLSKFLRETQARLEKYPLALVGEVGLDAAFRLPGVWRPGEGRDRDKSRTPGAREGRRLSPYRVQLEHQKKVLTAQLKLAGEMQRAVSVHGVQAHGVLYDTLHATWKGCEKQVISKSKMKRQTSVTNAHNHEIVRDNPDAIEQRSFPPRICLHSFSGHPDTIRQYLRPSVPVDFYFSFSMVNNFSTAAASKTKEAIKAVPDHRILIESDLHVAGKRMDDNLEAIAKEICSLKEWNLKHGVKQLKENWKAFIFGT